MTDRFEFQKDNGHTEHWCDLLLKHASDEEIRRAVLATIADFLDKKSTANLIELLPLIDTQPAPKEIMQASGPNCVGCRITIKRGKEASRRRARHRKCTHVFDFGICFIVGATAMMAVQQYMPGLYAWLLGGCVSWAVYFALRKSREGEFQR